MMLLDPILCKITLLDKTNSAFGSGALQSNTTGSYNSAFGIFALTANTTGNYNTGVGYNAVSGSTYWGNTGVGYSALNANGGYNTAIGYNAGSLGGWPNGHGEYNVFKPQLIRDGINQEIISFILPLVLRHG